MTLAAYEQYAKMLPPVIWEGYRNSIVASLDDQGPRQHLVAEDAGTIVGSVLLYPAAASPYGLAAEVRTAIPEMRLLAVLPAMRGQGIGTCTHQKQWGNSNHVIPTFPLLGATCRADA